MPIDLPPELQKKIGPLPVWAWGGLGGGAVLFLFLRRGGGSGGETAGDPVTAGSPSAANGMSIPDFGAGVVDPGLSQGASFGGFEDPVPAPALIGPADQLSLSDPGQWYYFEPTPLTDPIVGFEAGDETVLSPSPFNPIAGPIVGGGLRFPSIAPDYALDLPDVQWSAPSGFGIDPQTGGWTGQFPTAAKAIKSAPIFPVIEPFSSPAGTIARNTTISIPTANQGMVIPVSSPSRIDSSSPLLGHGAVL